MCISLNINPDILAKYGGGLIAGDPKPRVAPGTTPTSGGAIPSTAPMTPPPKNPLLNPDWASQPSTLTPTATGPTNSSQPGWIDTHGATHDENAQINALNNGATGLINAGTDKLKQDQNTSQQLIDTLNSSTNGLLAGLQEQNKTLATLLSSQSGDFAKQQSALVDAQKQQAQAATDTANAILQSRNQAVQGVKKPNFAEVLRKQKVANSGGLSSTMLTGPTGVSAGSMSLGFNTLLGS